MYLIDKNGINDSLSLFSRSSFILAHLSRGFFVISLLSHARVF